MEENKNIWMWVLALLALLFLFGTFGMGGYGMMGAGMGFGFVFMLLFWALLIWIVVLLVNAYQPDKEEPLTTLKKRYASGKISKKEFEKMKKEVR